MAGDALCKVDFYLLGSPRLDAEKLACKLAMMAWERGHHIHVCTRDDRTAAVDELMWTYPEGRFLPHEPATDTAVAPIRVGGAPPADADLVINLTPEPLAVSSQWRRLLEIVPHDPADREASRTKFRAYRAHGLAPDTHEMN